MDAIETHDPRPCAIVPPTRCPAFGEGFGALDVVPGGIEAVLAPTDPPVRRQALPRGRYFRADVPGGPVRRSRRPNSLRFLQVVGSGHPDGRNTRNRPDSPPASGGPRH